MERKTWNRNFVGAAAATTTAVRLHVHFISDFTITKAAICLFFASFPTDQRATVKHLAGFVLSIS